MNKQQALDEQKALNEFYPNMSFQYMEKKEKLCVTGWIKSTWWKKNYRLLFIYPDNYPYEPPRAYILEPAVKSDVHQFKDGELCLFHKDAIGAGKTWDPYVNTIVLAISWSILWINAWEYYKDTGIWVPKEAPH